MKDRAQKPFSLNFMLQKSYFALIPVVAFSAFVFLFIYAYLLDLQRDPIKAGDMAPFFATAGKAAPLPSVRTTLSAPIYSTREITAQVETLVVDGLSLSTVGLSAVQARVSPFFTPSGVQSYQAFLQNSGILQALEQGGYQTNAVLAGVPQETASGVYGGVYKWLFSVPVMVGYIPQGGAGLATAITKKITLKIQVTRTIPSIPSASPMPEIGVELFQAN